MKKLSSSLVILVLIGCGENSSSTKNINFAGQEIDGLKYVNNGAEVSFYVGDILLAKTVAHENMTLFNMLNVKAPVKALDVKKSLKDNSLNKVMNIASFLQTLDKDGDASNGIEIPKELDALTKDVYLDFNASSYTFSHSFALRKLMAEGRKNGIWEADRHIVKPYVALDVLYASLNLKPEIFVVKFNNYKSHNHAITSIDRNTSNVFDTLGRVESSIRNGNDPRTANDKKLFFYDEYFNKVREEVYLESNVTIQLDANGNAYFTYEESNGTFTLHQIREHSYNVNMDVLTSRAKDVKYGYFPDRNITISYDGYGNLITYERSDYHSYRLNNTEKLCGISEYNSLGLKTLEKFDNNCDGIDNQLTEYIYDVNNKAVITLYDSDANGLIDANISVAFDDEKRVETMLIYTDGVIDSKKVYIYDKHNHIVYSSYERNGIVSYEDNRTYTYSRTGKILSEEVHNKEGTLSETAINSYDALDNVLVSERKDILNDIVIYKATYTYDSNGYKLTSEVDYGTKYTETFTYDTFGNQLTYKKITEQDNDIIKIETNKSYINTSKWLSLSYFFGEE
jgi:hypothetical protein